MTKVFVVDDRELVRRGVVDVLERMRGISVVGEAGSRSELERRFPAVEPDIVVVRASLVDAGAAIDPTDLLVIVARSGEQRVTADLPVQATGVELARVIAQSDGGASRPRQRIPLPIQQTWPAPDTRLTTLNRREREVFTLLGGGLSNRRIGDILELSEKTVKNYVSNVFSKLGVQSRAQAAVLEIRSDEVAVVASRIRSERLHSLQAIGAATVSTSERRDPVTHTTDFAVSVDWQLSGQLVSRRRTRGGPTRT